MDDTPDPWQLFRIVGVRRDGRRVTVMDGLDRDQAAELKGRLGDLSGQFEKLEVEAYEA